MYDRPTALELLEAACQHLEQHVIPALKGDRKLYFQTLVAVNVLKIVGRDLQEGLGFLIDEWARLNLLEGVAMPLPEDPELYAEAIKDRNKALCAAIRLGEFTTPERRASLLDHLMVSLREQLAVANPRFLQSLAEEDGSISAS